MALFLPVAVTAAPEVAYDPAIYRIVDTPVRTHIDVERVGRTLNIQVSYSNPAGSGATGYWRWQDVDEKGHWSIATADGNWIKRKPRDRRGPTEPVPLPIRDKDYQKLRPGRGGKVRASIDLQDYVFPKGEHRYTVRFLPTVLLPSTETRILEQENKVPVAPAAYSNRAEFAYDPTAPVPRQPPSRPDSPFTYFPAD